MEELLASLIEYAKPDYVPEMDSFLQSLLDDALEEVCNEMYPRGFSSASEKKRIEDMAILKYRSTIKAIAKYHFDKKGREGVSSWSEGGVSVTYESSGTPSSLLRNIIPVAKIV